MKTPCYAADKYRANRPGYPDELYQLIYAEVSHFDLAWDCACGNGQATTTLAKQFKQVIATDISAEQIEHAEPKANIEYRVESAEHTQLANQSIDLITVAQAAHWLEPNAFSREVKRVLKPDGVLAVWGYSYPSVNPKLDDIAVHLAYEVYADYWAPGREHIDSNYQTLTFPFNNPKQFTITAVNNWDIDKYIGFLESWSSRRKYIEQHEHDVLDDYRQALKQAWGSDTSQDVKWRINLLIGCND